MRPRELLFTAAASILAACSSGSGGDGRTTVIPSESREPPGASSDPTGGGRESPGAGREDPGSGSSPSSSGGSGSGGGGVCPKCDYVYQCSVTGQQRTDKVVLGSSNGSCLVVGSNGTQKLNCDGTFVESSSAASITLHWSSDGHGGYVITIPASTAGPATSVSCLADRPATTDELNPPQPTPVASGG